MALPRACPERPASFPPDAASPPVRQIDRPASVCRDGAAPHREPAAHKGEEMSKLSSVQPGQLGRRKKLDAGGAKLVALALQRVHGPACRVGVRQRAAAGDAGPSRPAGEDEIPAGAAGRLQVVHKVVSAQLPVEPPQAGQHPTRPAGHRPAPGRTTAPAARDPRTVRWSGERSRRPGDVPGSPRTARTTARNPRTRRAGSPIARRITRAARPPRRCRPTATRTPAA